MSKDCSGVQQVSQKLETVKLTPEQDSKDHVTRYVCVCVYFIVGVCISTLAWTFRYRDIRQISFFFFQGKGLGSFQNVISPAALTCSGVSVVSGPKYIYSLKTVKTMYSDNWQSSSWTLGGKQ